MKAEKILAVRNTKTIFLQCNKVVKLFDESFTKADILNEALNHCRVEGIGLNIPEFLDVEKIDGKWALISEFIEGDTLGTLMQKKPSKQDEYLNLFVDLQLSVHSKKLPTLNKLKDKISRKIELTELNATTRYDLQTRLESMPKHDKLCHGDFNPSNIVINKSNKPFILDWSHVAQGNGSADVANTYLTFLLSGDKAMADKYLELICQKSGTPKKYILNWMPIVSAVQLANGKKEEKDFLLNIINVVDYE